MPLGDFAPPCRVQADLGSNSISNISNTLSVCLAWLQCQMGGICSFATNGFISSGTLNQAQMKYFKCFQIAFEHRQGPGQA
jgi:hypothetical protein